MNIIEKINDLLGEESIDWDAVEESLRSIAKEIFDEVDDEKIKGMLNTIKKKNPEDTEEAIGIAETMMRNE